jgi:hypothetical protein
MTTTTKRTKDAAKSNPALHVQVSTVRIPIWKNEGGEDGKVYFKAGKPELSYKDSEGRWQTAKSYGPRDLVNLIKAASLAHSEILQRNHASKAPATEEADETE